MTEIFLQLIYGTFLLKRLNIIHSLRILHSTEGTLKDDQYCSYDFEYPCIKRKLYTYWIFKIIVEIGDQ